MKKVAGKADWVAVRDEREEGEEGGVEQLLVGSDEDEGEEE